jgi:DNA repair exonuclease SbcCD ATPase subunit
MGAFESGQAFLAGVISKLPAELQAQAKELFEKPEAKDAVVIVGDGALARPDYSKAMNELKTKETELTEKLGNLNTWYDENKAALEDYVAIKPEYDRLQTTPHVPPKDPPPPADPRKLIEDVLSEQGPEFVRVSAWLAGITAKHQHMFGEPLDPVEIVSHPKLGKPIVGQPGRVFSLQDAYTEKYGERVAQKLNDAEEKKFNDEVEKRLGEERKKLGTQPFPLRHEAPSVLDVLATKDGPAAHTLDSAVAEYERLQQQRG